MTRLLIDLKTDCNGMIVGSIKLPADSPFVLEALAEVVSQFSKSCEIPPEEILDDLKGLV